MILLLISIVITQKKNPDQVNASQNKNQKVINALQETIKALQRDDIQRLIEHVKSVMRAEYIIEDTINPLRRYSYKEDSFPTMDRVVTSLEIYEITINGDIGEIKAGYGITYYNADDRVVRSSSSSRDWPTIWTIEKQGEDWVIIEINEHP